MPTPGELKKITKLVADLLARESNAELTAEEVAAEVSEAAITAYEEMRAKSHNLIVLGHFRLDGDRSFVAAVGPLSTRAATAAREIGERFAWDWRTKRGTGKFVRVPLIRDPHAAWDAARGATPLETEQLDLGGALEDALSLNMSDELTLRYGPTCTCGLRSAGRCQRHLERTTDGGPTRSSRADGSDHQR